MIMFRALLLGVMYSLSDRQLQYMLLDRTSFKPIVGLQSTDQVPVSLPVVYSPNNNG